MRLPLLAGDVNKVKRRLAQNREAARKSRQRRKAYVQSLEEEVRISVPDLKPAKLPGGSRCLGQSEPCAYSRASVDRGWAMV